MAGSLRHIVDDQGDFTIDLIENLGDAFEALEECFDIINVLSNGRKTTINHACAEAGYNGIDTDLRPSGLWRERLDIKQKDNE